ncbi:4a-hydroxytetrahydrobiopterin dehydratase [Pontibacillus yanchengensis]|uniref:Putative pterin-4-alpha-carbinolamine dehydratase n=1 Tax=Pontibacillus yanchengensis Y32 TaxID=1385514 RepID=A0A0A2TGK7_9BACI|nr:4a-hydroxytetrahydrobiopterin dehydratase [Pontibacillus yanchengensis]KGP73246.1 pterin dehydratase [Pontibacillus yanchengensis Y32]
MSTLSQTEIKQKHEDIPQWEVKDEVEIERVYTFAQYKDGLEFVQQIGTIADEKDHHPSIRLEYKEVIVALTSHDVGGLTNRDFDLAQRFDEVYENRK